MLHAILSEREPVGGGLHRVRLGIEPSLAASHTKHGQYIELRYEPIARKPDEETTIVAATRGYFVLTTTPGDATWDVVVKEGGAMADRMQSLPLGQKLIASEAQGPGYPVDEAKGNPLVFAATGSGIAAALSTIGARIASGDAKHTYLLYGVREKKDVALVPELDAMRAAGVDVAICLSREHLHEAGFFKGYVQHVAIERRWDLSKALVFAAGNKEMVKGLRAAAEKLGIAAAAIRLNQ